MGSEKPSNAEQGTGLTLLEEYWQRLLSQSQEVKPPAKVEGKRWRSMGDVSKAAPMNKQNR